MLEQTVTGAVATAPPPGAGRKIVVEICDPTGHSEEEMDFDAAARLFDEKKKAGATSFFEAAGGRQLGNAVAGEGIPAEAERMTVVPAFAGG